MTEAQSGFDAMRLLPRARYDLIITDINMPDVNGLELIHFIRKSEQYRTTPLVIISTQATERDVERGRKLGADAYVPKPFTAGALRAACEQLLDASPSAAAASARCAGERRATGGQGWLSTRAAVAARAQATRRAKSSSPRRRRSSTASAAICSPSTRSVVAAASDAELVNDVFRAVHTLKGLSGLFGAAMMCGLSHELENLLDDLRLGRIELTPQVLDLLFQSVELYGRILPRRRATAPEPAAEVKALLAALGQVAQQKGGGGGERRRSVRARSRACSACSPSTKSIGSARTSRPGSRSTGCACSSSSRRSTRRSTT